MEEDDDFGDLYGASEGDVDVNVNMNVDDDPDRSPVEEEHKPHLENEDDDHLYELSDEELLYGDSSASQPKQTGVIINAGDVVPTANAEHVAEYVAEINVKEESDEEDLLYRELYRPDDTSPPSARVESAPAPARSLSAVGTSGSREKPKEELEEFPYAETEIPGFKPSAPIFKPLTSPSSTTHVITSVPTPTAEHAGGAAGEDGDSEDDSDDGLEIVVGDPEGEGYEEESQEQYEEQHGDGEEGLGREELVFMAGDVEGAGKAAGVKGSTDSPSVAPAVVGGPGFTPQSGSKQGGGVQGSPATPQGSGMSPYMKVSDHPSFPARTESRHLTISLFFCFFFFCFGRSMYAREVQGPIRGCHLAAWGRPRRPHVRQLAVHGAPTAPGGGPAWNSLSLPTSASH